VIGGIRGTRSVSSVDVPCKVHESVTILASDSKTLTSNSRRQRSDATAPPISSVMIRVAGSRLGPYEIIALLGAGGMGEVYRARDTRLQRDVAIKVLPASTAPDTAARDRLQREARAVAALNWPRLLPAQK
jgi:serine/threonine protein kinase